MKSVSEQEWKKKAEGLAEWRKNRTSPPNLDLYKRIVSMVHVGESVADIGSGQCHLKTVLPDGVLYQGIDPFPLSPDVSPYAIEDLIVPVTRKGYRTVFMLAALDNVRDVKQALKGLKHLAAENIVILTGIDIPVDKFHTHSISRQDLVNELGDPEKELELLPNVYLFEFFV